ncbi:unnamed protein product [Lampetra fluviatilis]
MVVVVGAPHSLSTHGSMEQQQQQEQQQQEEASWPQQQQQLALFVRSGRRINPRSAAAKKTPFEVANFREPSRERDTGRSGESATGITQQQQQRLVDGQQSSGALTEQEEEEQEEGEEEEV